MKMGRNEFTSLEWSQQRALTEAESCFSYFHIFSWTFADFSRFKIINNFLQLIQRRSLKEPIAHILKEKEFWSKIFYVNTSTLIPRPETELLVDKILKIYIQRVLAL